MDIFLLNKKDIDSKTILHKNLSNMHIALRNMHIAQVSIAVNIDTLCGGGLLCLHLHVAPSHKLTQGWSMPLHGGGLRLHLRVAPSHTHAGLGLHLQKKGPALCSLVKIGRRFILWSTKIESGAAW